MSENFAQQLVNRIMSAVHLGDTDSNVYNSTRGAPSQHSPVGSTQSSANRPASLSSPPRIPPDVAGPAFDAGELYEAGGRASSISSLRSVVPANVVLRDKVRAPRPDANRQAARGVLGANATAVEGNRMAVIPAVPARAGDGELAEGVLINDDEASSNAPHRALLFPVLMLLLYLFYRWIFADDFAYMHERQRKMFGM